jgi:hypothetical protein
MLNGLSWTPRDKRKKYGFRVSEAHSAILNYFNERRGLDKGREGSSFKRLTKRVRAAVLKPRRVRNPIRYALVGTILKKWTAVLGIRERGWEGVKLVGRWVPLSKRLETVRIRSRSKPSASALRLTFLLGAATNAGQFTPMKVGYSWKLRRAGFLLKGPFRRR